MLKVSSTITIPLRSCLLSREADCSLKQFAIALGIPLAAGSSTGTISIGAVMRLIQIDQFVNGETKSMMMLPLRGAAGADAPVPGSDVIVGGIESVDEFGNTKHR